jgi:hypothetical protein
MRLEYKLSLVGLNRNSRLSTSFRFQAYGTKRLGMLLDLRDLETGFWLRKF